MSKNAAAHRKKLAKIDEQRQIDYDDQERTVTFEITVKNKKSFWEWLWLELGTICMRRMRTYVYRGPAVSEYLAIKEQMLAPKSFIHEKGSLDSYKFDSPILVTAHDLRYLLTQYQDNREQWLSERAEHTKDKCELELEIATLQARVQSLTEQRNYTLKKALAVNARNNGHITKDIK